MEELSELLLHLLSLGQQLFQGKSPPWRSQFQVDKLLNTTCLIYHPGPTEEKEKEEKIYKTTVEHTDATWITLLIQDQQGGLQLRNQKGNWINANPVENGIIVNTGNVLSQESGGFFKAVCHRVIRTQQSASQTRFSIPFFYNKIGSQTGGC